MATKLIRAHSWRPQGLVNAALAPIRALSGACMRISKQFTILDRNGDAVLPTSVLGKRARGEEEPAGEESRWAKRAKLCPITLSVLSSCGLKHPPKPAQIAAVDAVREGRDTFYASPTSTGKGEAIRYLNHLLDKGTLIVVEPLTSLTKEFAERFGDLAAYVDHTNKDEQLLKDIRAGKYRIVFVTPESAVEGDFMNGVLMKEEFRKQAVGFVFDEAHTLDQWGRDFRPKFLQLGRVRRHLDVPALVMSATLTKEARIACELTLEMQRPLFIDVGTDRPNLHLRVLPMQHPIAGFLDVLSVLPELWQSAAEGASTLERMKKFLVTLVYINSKDAATNLKHVLDQWCLRAGFKDIVQLYHADLTDEHRSKILMLINTGKILIVICTDAFGMGADCRAILRVIQLKLFGGVSAWWQRMGRAGRDFADEAEAILFVESAHMTAETRKHIAATGELPAPPEIDEVDEDGPITLENDVALIRSGTDSRAVAKKIVDDELLMLARHGLARDACIRRLVLDHLAQPKAETLPRHEELYHASRPIPPGRELPCCSTCDYEPLPTVPEEFAPSKETIPALPGITNTQGILRGRLEAWRSKQWPAKWRGLNRAGRMGIDAFMAQQDIDAIVSNLKVIAHNISQGDSRLGQFVNMQPKDVVLPDLEEEIVAVLEEEREKRDAEKEVEEAEKRRRAEERAEEQRQRRSERRDDRSERELQARIQQATSSGSSQGPICGTCAQINAQTAGATVDGRQHRRDSRVCPGRRWLEQRKPVEGESWPETWMEGVYRLSFGRRSGSGRQATM